MIIESIIGVVVTLAVVYLFWQAILKEEGSVVVEKVAEKVVSIADVNKDGKVNVDDIKTVAKKVEDAVSTTVSKTKRATKKPAESDIKAPVVAETATPKRARNAKGKLVADNPATPEVNEAWEGGKAPAPKPKKPRKPKMTVAK